MDIAKVFMTGRSQAVRLPKAYRFDTDEVTIERAPDGAVVLRPKPRPAGNLGERVRRILEKAGDTSDFARPEQPPLERDAAWWDAHGFGPSSPPTRNRKPGTSR
jgi:antitoxin VapB